MFHRATPFWVQRGRARRRGGGGGPGRVGDGGDSDRVAPGGYYWWRLKRNIGWLDYQVSHRCSDRPLCESAKDAHLHAINGDGNHKGNVNYILAYRNLGRIHEMMGELRDAEGGASRRSGTSSEDDRPKGSRRVEDRKSIRL